MKSLFSFFLLTLAIAPQAQASVACKATLEDGKKLEFTIDVANGGATSTLLVDGREIPALRPCLGWAHGNPNMGTRWRCPHGLGALRFELYPTLGNETSELAIIRWDGAHVSPTLTSEDCQ